MAPIYASDHAYQKGLKGNIKQYGLDKYDDLAMKVDEQTNVLRSIEQHLSEDKTTRKQIHQDVKRSMARNPAANANQQILHSGVA